MPSDGAIGAAGVLSEDWLARGLPEFLAASEAAVGDPPGRTSRFLDRMMLDRRILAMLGSLPGCLPHVVASDAIRRALDPSAIRVRIEAVFSEVNWPKGKPHCDILGDFARHALDWVVAEGNGPLALRLFAVALANLAAHAWRTPDGTQLPPDLICAEVERSVMLPGGAGRLGPVDLHHLGVGYMIPLVHGFGPEETSREHMHLLGAYASRTNFMKLSESQMKLYEPRLKAMAAVAIYTEAVSLLLLMRAADHVAGRAGADRSPEAATPPVSETSADIEE